MHVVDESGPTRRGGSDDGYRTLKLLPTYRDRDGMPTALTRENWDDVRHAIANAGGESKVGVALAQFFDLYENDNPLP
ncbi:hypothetical protein BSZ39_07270 [Bowdeniella nasicola]|uniref:Uncharacterized protein n=1 Tax=Bowdeniella nasicola TaxID=208480 RepID=A0A1Q5Q1U6_9ACTO|nr:hypothetical protein [Bowdeniella nasicola]OKL53844.1 hypothetical protein BSZ39_07270 [Bowdeniella nasicola]